jgi:TolA-binding protein
LSFGSLFVSRFVPVLLAAAVLLPAPLAAQAVDVGKLDRRVGTLESEMRAVQRKVFPGGNARFFEPEIPAQAATPAPAPETPPATTPIADLTGRVDALEGQLKTMTGQIEAMEYKLRQLEDGQRRLKGDAEFRLNALENPGGAPPAPAADPAAVPGKLPAPSAATPAQAPAKPGVESAMSQFIADWPKSIRVPQAKYWLGRSFAARTQYPQAAKAFLDVYQSAPRSTPAPDALIALAGALNAMTKPKDACQVLGELESVYGAKLTDTQKADAGRQRTKAKCTA